MCCAEADPTLSIRTVCFVVGGGKKKKVSLKFLYRASLHARLHLAVSTAMFLKTGTPVSICSHLFLRTHNKKVCKQRFDWVRRLETDWMSAANANIWKKPKCADHHSACQRPETAEGAGDECEGEGKVHQCKIEIWPRHNSRKPPWCSRHYEALECKCCFGAAFPQHTDCMEPVGTVRCQSDLLPLQGGTGNTTFMDMASLPRQNTN